jgi:hypothetical protein
MPLGIRNATDPRNPLVCAVAMVRDELPFLDEWLAYHRLLGIEHFFLYDDDPALPLRQFLIPHSSYVTIIDWHHCNDGPSGTNRQTKAFNDSLDRILSRFRWVAFIDIDEFIVLPAHPGLPSFLDEFGDFGQISMPWYIFGHNGHFADPPGLVTTSLIRRKLAPRLKRVKSS